MPEEVRFVVTLAAIHNRDSVQLSEPARRVIAAYSWPGNLRELRNALERAIIFSKIPELQPEDFPDNIRAAAGGDPRGAALIELLHTASLVHDDVVDEANYRRGFFSINARPQTQPSNMIASQWMGG